LLACVEIDILFVRAQALQIKGDAYAKRGGRAPEREEFELRLI